MSSTDRDQRWTIPPPHGPHPAIEGTETLAALRVPQREQLLQGARWVILRP
jgi:hypothetical protein